MRHKSCPQALRKYGWCGVLALVYALGMPMPQTENEFDELLARLQRTLGKKKPLWKRSDDFVRNKRRGGITCSESRLVLTEGNCAHSLEAVKASGTSMNFKAWLKTLKSNSRYIVHTSKHAVFVDVPKVCGRWKIYDQSGPKSRSDLQTMKGKGGLLRQRVNCVFTLLSAETAVAAPQSADSSADPAARAALTPPPVVSE